MVYEVDVSTLSGLSEQEAQARLQQEGYNELPTEKRRSVVSILLGVVREPMFLLLLAAGSIYLIVGDAQEGFVLLSFVFVIIGITFYQERRTERTLEALRDLSSPRALVIRSGAEQRIAGREVVRNDIVLLREGDRVPADGVLLSSTNLSIDESLLTGESVPVRKKAGGNAKDVGRPGGEGTPYVYSGTLVVRGQGVAEIRAIGANTEIGRIGAALRSVDEEKTPLQIQTGKLVRDIALFATSLFIIVVLTYGVVRGNWLEGLLAAIALAMTMLPEEFPVVLTVFLVLGAWRISQQQVLTRRAPAVETLGAATVLCVDKTGTITLNKMSVKTICANGEQYDVDYTARKPLPETFHEIVEFSILASQKDPFDPMEKAFKELGECYLTATEHLHADWTLVREYPLSEQLMALSHVWRSPNEDEYIIAAKGAPEAIADLCHFTEVQQRELAGRINVLANMGLRVLGVAKAQFLKTTLPSEQHEFTFEFLGLVGLADPVRPQVPQAVQECYTAGIRVIMITGDYPGTAKNIAQQIGLTQAEIITGPELEKVSEETLQERIKTVSIFARTVPEQKLRLVRALKANGDVVAMTGDGVNDAPAMKAADIGVAMGGRGTDVAREASALVLLNDDFSSIVHAIRLGRRIYDNIKKAMAYIVAIHVPIAGVSLFPVLFNWPLILLPVHIVFLELIIDPACSIVFEAEPAELNVMDRPPRNPRAPLFTRQALSVSLFQGLSILLLVMLIHNTAAHYGLSENAARAVAFTTLVIANLCLIISDKSWASSIISVLHTRNVALWWVVGGALAFLAGALYIPILQDIFHFAPLSIGWIIASVAIGMGSLVLFELVKILARRYIKE